MCILKKTSPLKPSYSASWAPITVEEFKVHYLYQSSSPKIPGRQISIRFRVDGNRFTTPLISVLNYWLCYVVLQMCILKNTYWSVHIGLNHPFIVGYGSNILCHRVNINR